MPEEFDLQPSTKRDLAEVKEELVEKIESVEQRLEEKIEKGFDRLTEYFKGPHGFTERLEKVEERMGLR